ncbi:XrtA/PEP-CTERM system TPR-repeat protein PrsT [Catenovulum agarivorans]|uniref:XrtA/PEP-CTERM system TPR-repeat protein PrsT n=1 Tax=Catenovulum agarivorans TaxID=1172192 RepID=UPI000304156A|nr:XrtA/PEP-CTERM system TPR-repeat protein PrsT [Catenovulum agarivorans]
MNTPFKLSTIALCIALTGCFGKTADEHFQQATDYINDNKTDAAIVELKNAIEQNTEQAVYRFTLGELYFQTGQTNASEKELLRALELGLAPEQQTAANNLLVKNYYLNNSFSAILELAKKHDTSVIQYYAAAVDIEDRKYQEAVDKFENIIQQNQQSDISALAKAYIAISEQKTDEAINLVEQVLAEDANNFDALILKGRIGLMQGQSQHAVSAYESLTKLMPKYPQFQIFLATAYIGNNDFDKAEPVVARLLKALPNGSYIQQLKSQVEFNNKNFEQAKLFSEKAIQGNIDTSMNRLIAGYSNYQLAKYEQAFEHLSAIADQIPNDHIAKRLLIDLQLKLGYDELALKNLKNMTNVTESDASLLTSASQYLLQSGDSAAAQELLETSISLTSDNPNEIAKQGLMQLKLNQGEQGIESLEKALQLNPELALAKQGLAMGYLSQGKLEEALKIAKQWQGESDVTQQTQGHLLEATIFEQQQQPEQAQEKLETVLKLDGNNPAALFKLALYQHKAEQYQQALDKYTKLISNNSSHAPAMRNLLTIANQDAKFAEQAEAFYKKAIIDKPQDNLLKLGQAYLFSLQNKNKQALETLTSIKNSQNPINGIELLIGDVHLKQKEWKQAIDNFKSVNVKNPDSLRAAQKLFTTYEITGDLDNALLTVEKTLVRHPNNIGLKLLKLDYQSRQGKPLDQTALKDVKTTPTTASHWMLSSILGNQAITDKNFHQANEHYKTAYEKQPNAKNVIAWSRTAARVDSPQKAIEILQGHLDKETSELEKKKSANVQAMLANAYLNIKDYKSAEVEYLELNKNQPNNPLVLNNLAYINLQFKQNEQALTYAEQAVEALPQSPAIIDTYGMALLANGKAKQALAQFDLALSKTSGNIEMSVNKAKALTELGQKDQASSLLNSLNPTTDNEKQLVAEAKSQL